MSQSTTSSDDFEECWRELTGFTSPEQELLYAWAARVAAYQTTSIGPTDDKCDDCGSTEGVKLEPSRTAYHWDGRGEDPNKPIPLCRDCAVEHHAYWNDLWSNVEY